MDIREMLRHMRRGQSNRAVAEPMGIDRKTVARYRSWASEQALLEDCLFRGGDQPSLTCTHARQ